MIEITKVRQSLMYSMVGGQGSGEGANEWMDTEKRSGPKTAVTLSTENHQLDPDDLKG